MNIEIIRDSYSKNTTLGKMYINGEYFCETLEDTVRPFGIKVKGETAIPDNIVYKVSLSVSNRFKRLMPILYTESDLNTLKGNGISFIGVRFHGGNDDGDTAGCPLVAKNRIGNNKIQGTMEKPLTEKIQDALQKGEDVTCLCVNMEQAG